MSTARLVSRPFLVDRVMEQVDLPMAFLADLDEVGGGLDAVIEPLLSLQGAALVLVPLAGFVEAKVPGFLDPAIERTCRASAGRRPRCRRRGGEGSSRTGCAAAPRPWGRSSPIRPSCPRRTSRSASAGRSATAPVGERSTPVVHALLEDVAIKRAIIIHTQTQMF